MEIKSKILIRSFIGAIIILTICFLISGNITLNDLTPNFLEGVVSANILGEEGIDFEVIKNETLRTDLRTTDSIYIKDGITKEYIFDEKRVLFLEDKEILLNLQLESDYEVVVLGWNDMDLIAWFNLEDYSGIDFVDNVKFYDVNNNYTELIKGYVFKYKTRGNVSVCDELGKKCEMIEDDVWIEFNSLLELPSKNIQIGLFTDIVEGDKIEWVIEKDGFYILEWAVVLGTSSGFVVNAPSSDPVSPSYTVDNLASVDGDTSPATATKITEVGFWLDGGVDATNMQFGLYADSAGVPGARLYTTGDVAKGTNTKIWRNETVDWAISSSTKYWIAIQIDNTGNAVRTNYVSSGGGGYDTVTAATLPNPFNGGSLIDSNGMLSIYAVWEAGGDETPPTYSLNQTNTTTAGELALFSILYDDNTALESDGGYIFSTNNSGVWDNESLVLWTTTPEWANVTKTLPANAGNRTDYRWYANDSAGNVNNTEVFYLITTEGVSSCASLVSGVWYVPAGCECYCEGESLNLNDCSCV